MNTEQIDNLVQDLLRAFRAGAPPAGVLRSIIRNAIILAKQTSRNREADGHMDIHCQSIVAGRDYSPVIQIEWGEKMGQLSPGETRDFAERLRRTADAAESDAFVFQFMTEKVSLDANRAAQVLYDFREFREKRARMDYDLRVESKPHAPMAGEES